MGNRQKFWTPERWELAKKLKADDYPNAAIALRLGISERKVSAKFNDYHTPLPSPRVSPQQIADRDARRAAADKRDQTAEFCGDPPRGFSALEQRGRSAR